MATLQEALIETISKDLTIIGSLDDGKSTRKECSLLLSRIESAKKLVQDDEILLKKLAELQNEVEGIKAK